MKWLALICSVSVSLFLSLFPSLSLCIVPNLSSLCLGEKSVKKERGLAGPIQRYIRTHSQYSFHLLSCMQLVCLCVWLEIHVSVVLLARVSLSDYTQLSFKAVSSFVLFCVAFPSSSSPLFFLNFTLCAFLFIPEWLDFLLVYTLVLCLSNWHPAVIIALVCQLIVWSKCKCGHFLTHTWVLHTPPFLPSAFPCNLLCISLL